MVGLVLELLLEAGSLCYQCVNLCLQPVELSWLGTACSCSAVVSGKMSSFIQWSAFLAASVNVTSAFSLMYHLMALFRKTGFRPPAKVSCSMTLERVPTWTALVFTQRR